MKKLLLLVTLTCIAFSVFTQTFFTEDFNYLAGQLTSANGGANVSGGNWKSYFGGAPYIQVVSGNLEFPNYYSNPTVSSKKISLVFNGYSSENVYRLFKPVNPGTVYASFLFKLNGAISAVPLYGTNGTFFAHFGTSQINQTTTDLKIRQGTTAGTIQFGIAAKSVSNIFFLTWIPIDYSAATTHLITFSCERITGDTNDISRLWVDQPYSATPPNALATSTVTDGREATDVGSFILTHDVNADIDAIKVSNSYSDVALPLGLTFLNASFNGKNVDLKWAIADERNLKGFSLERRSSDGDNFVEFAFVTAKNEANIAYTFSDINIHTGVNSYRIKMVDADGRIRYSQVVTIINKNEIITTVYPSPASGNISLVHAKASEGALIKLFDVQGRQIKVCPVEKGATQTALTISELSKGTYILIIENSGKTAVTTFLKQ